MRRLLNPRNLGMAECKEDAGDRLLITIDKARIDVWIPKSCIHEDSDVKKVRDIGYLYVTDKYKNRALSLWAKMY